MSVLSSTKAPPPQATGTMCPVCVKPCPAGFNVNQHLASQPHRRKLCAAIQDRKLSGPGAMEALDPMFATMAADLLKSAAGAYDPMRELPLRKEEALQDINRSVAVLSKRPPSTTHTLATPATALL